MTLKLHRQKVIDEEVEIHEGAYIAYLIQTLLDANPTISFDIVGMRYMFAEKVGKMYEQSVREGKFIEATKIQNINMEGVSYLDASRVSESLSPLFNNKRGTSKS